MTYLWRCTDHGGLKTSTAGAYLPAVPAPSLPPTPAPAPVRDARPSVSEAIGGKRLLDEISQSAEDLDRGEERAGDPESDAPSSRKKCFIHVSVSAKVSRLVLFSFSCSRRGDPRCSYFPILSLFFIFPFGDPVWCISRLREKPCAGQQSPPVLAHFSFHPPPAAQRSFAVIRPFKTFSGPRVQRIFLFYEHFEVAGCTTCVQPCCPTTFPCHAQSRSAGRVLYFLLFYPVYCVLLLDTYVVCTAFFAACLVRIHLFIHLFIYFFILFVFRDRCFSCTLDHIGLVASFPFSPHRNHTSISRGHASPRSCARSSPAARRPSYVSLSLSLYIGPDRPLPVPRCSWLKRVFLFHVGRAPCSKGRVLEPVAPPQLVSFSAFSRSCSRGSFSRQSLSLGAPFSPPVRFFHAHVRTAFATSVAPSPPL